MVDSDLFFLHEVQFNKLFLFIHQLFPFLVYVDAIISPFLLIIYFLIGGQLFFQSFMPKKAYISEDQ